MRLLKYLKPRNKLLQILEEITSLLYVILLQVPDTEQARMKNEYIIRCKLHGIIIRLVFSNSLLVALLHLLIQVDYQTLCDLTNSSLLKNCN